jgi:hypothetical protein
LPTCGSTPAWRDDLATGTFELLADVDFGGLEPSPAGRSRRGWATWAARWRIVPVANKGPGPKVSRADSEPLSRHRFEMVARIASVGLTGAEKAEWEALAPQLRPRSTAGPGRREIPERRWPGPRRAASLSAPRRPALAVGRGGRGSGPAVGFRRVEIEGVHLLINGAAVLIHGVNRHDFDQHTGRVISPSRCARIWWR